MNFKLLTDDQINKAFSDCTKNIIQEHENELEDIGEINAWPVDEIDMIREGVQYMHNLFTACPDFEVEVHGTMNDYENVIFTVKTSKGIRHLLSAWNYAMQLF